MIQKKIMASSTAYLLMLVALEMFCHCNALWTETQDGRQELVLYPRVGKRSASPDPHVMRRRDFLNFLANSWQRTGSLRGAIHEIQDMTESKRSQPLIFPGPRVGRSAADQEDDQQQQQQANEVEKKWSKARIGKKSLAPVAVLGDDDGNTITYFEEQPKRVPFARLG